jgi:predicted nucleic acid-binding protein
VIALDTSVLIRYLTDDVPALGAAAAEWIEGDEPVTLSAMVLLETIHVLRGAPYRVGNPALADVLIELLNRENLELTGLDAELALTAIASVRHLSPRHLADALIGAGARGAGARLLVTNDRKFVTELVPLQQLAAG